MLCVYWYTGLPLVCYMKIFALKKFSMKIFFQIMFVWQEMIWCLALNSKKIAFKTTQKKPPAPPPPPTHTHTHTHIKFQHAKGSINGSQGKGADIFYKTIKLCDCRFHCRRLMFWLYCLRYTYVFRIRVCTYFKQGFWADQIHLQ